MKARPLLLLLAPLLLISPETFAQSISAGAYRTAIVEDGNLLLYGLSLVWSPDIPTWDYLSSSNLERFYNNGLLIDSGVASVAAGDDHLLYIKEDSSLWVFGNSRHGQAATTNYTEIPIWVANRTKRIWAGEQTSFFTNSGDSLFVFGLNDWGQLGAGEKVQPKEIRTPVFIAADVVELSSRGDSGAFVKRDGSLWVFGRNSWVLNSRMFGAFGYWSEEYPQLWTPQKVLDSNVANVTTTHGGGLILYSDGTMDAFGANYEEELGYRCCSDNQLTRVFDGARSITSSKWTTAIIDSSNTLWLSYFPDGNLGSKYSQDETNRWMHAADNVLEVVVGDKHMAIRKVDESVLAIGESSSGQIGMGQTSLSKERVLVATNVNTSSLYDRHAAIVFNDGSLTLSGWNYYHQLCDSDRATTSNTIKLSERILQAKVTVETTLFLTESGALYGCGWRGNGGLGVPENSLQSTPILLERGVVDFLPFGHEYLTLDDAGTLRSSDNEAPIMTGVKRIKRVKGDNRVLASDSLGTVFSIGLGSYEYGSPPLAPEVQITNAEEFAASPYAFYSYNSQEGISVDTEYSVINNAELEMFLGIDWTGISVGGGGLSAGGEPNVALLNPKGDVVLWGANMWGELGLGSTQKQATGLLRAGNWREIEIGGKAAFWINKNDELFASGDGYPSIFSPITGSSSASRDWIRLTSGNNISQLPSSNTPPVAQISSIALPEPVVAPAFIVLSAQNSYDVDGHALNHAWVSSRGDYSFEQDFEPFFTSPGSESIWLIVDDGLSSDVDRLDVSVLSGVGVEPPVLPSKIALEKAYPNPFTSATNLAFVLPDARPILIEVTDILGRKVATLLAGETMAAGYHTVQLNADGLASGMYLIRMEAGDFVAAQHVLLLK
ncbi:MAG: T9SS type A sorting domain-containing protein [Bacteroidetes bacterium]|nr:T9SS type A sorting domain-containing protein [Verrucomicrobiota bacterium]MDA0873533.1 T9SS type A sorting domain-containing protein [Bacteroidota bacterium]